MKKLGSFLFLLSIICVFGGNNISCSPKKDSLSLNKISNNQIPKSIRYEGKLKEAYTWKDKNGEQLLILTETGEYQNKQFEESRDAKLFAYAYKIGKKNQLLWRLQDAIIDCPLDIGANFNNQPVTITDLNQNGIAEIWMVYKIICRSDISPCTMKIVMREGDKKYSITGETKIKVQYDEKGNPEYLGGEYQMDDALKNAPKSFQEFAKKLWDQEKTEDFEPYRD